MKKKTSRIIALIMALMLSLSCAVAASAGPIKDAKNAAEMTALTAAYTVADKPVVKAAGTKVVLDIVNLYFNTLPDTLVGVATVNDALGINLEDNEGGNVPVTISMGK